MDISKRAAFKYILVLLILFFHQALLASEPVNNKNTYLEVARTQLSLAFENHNKGDNAAAKENLKMLVNGYTGQKNIVSLKK